MRPLALLVALAAALLAAVPAAAELNPVVRGDGTPRVRAGTLDVPPRDARGRVEVIVALPQQPLARHGREVFPGLAVRRLRVGSSASQAYLRTLRAAQATAVATLRREIPRARVYRRYQVVLNALAVELPAADLPRLARLPFAARVYPNARYRLNLNRSPDVIRTDVLRARGGTRGEAMKIAIVDDGVNHRNPFFDPSGYSYPPGYPLGDRDFTTPKVIVARAYAPRSARGRDRLPFDIDVSFHGTHVAGIAAGNEATRAPAGDDHPPVEGLTGVAPRAWIGSYRVFTVRTEIGHVGNSAEIAAAFEQAVKDGMHVINFSGGGTEIEPAADILLRAVDNVTAAGVPVVVAAGNDRDEFGLGSTGSPGTAESAISVAATTNTHVFSWALETLAADAPAPIRRMALRPAPGGGLGRTGLERPIVDVGSITGTDGRPVDRLLCAPGADVNAARSTLPPRSLTGSLALASRGVCSFFSKAERARQAGAVGLILVDNRPGDPNQIPIQLPLPTGMIADLDGAALRAYLATHGGRTTVRIQQGPLQLETGRSAIVSDFSSGGPTAFGHRLKPDISAPGSEILSATTPRFGGPFAVFDGTSMATPHVAGAVALLLERHPTWTPKQVKSALMSTAGPAWANTARTVEAPVTMQGGGLVDLGRADAPLLFTDPGSLSFRDLDVSGGAQSDAKTVAVSDAGGGDGVWQVDLQPQAATTGATVEAPGVVQLAPGGQTSVTVTARAAGDAQKGENYGFVVLRRGDAVRRIPYFFLVKRPAFLGVPARTLRRTQTGDTRRGVSRTSVYRYPTAPFGPAADYVGPPMREDGAEQLFVTRIGRRVINFGAVVFPRSATAAPHPWVLGSRDENDVQGYAGTPVNVNNFTFGYRADIGAAGAVFPRPGEYFVVVDSGRDIFTGRSLAGRYELRSWVNDLRPPRVTPLTVRVAAGRPTLALRAVDPGRGSGVDPLSLVIGYRGVLVGAAAFDRESGIAVFPLPGAAPRIPRGRLALTLRAADFQEAKNAATPGDRILPNTRTRRVRVQAVAGPAVSWLMPTAGQCLRRNERLFVLASSTARIRSVRFLDEKRTVGVDRTGPGGLYSVRWRPPRGRAHARHQLRAVVLDARGRTYSAALRARSC
ncbi:MAG: S8 family serine peptidase [Thermoleophilia bacterium]|nr:S8 family serine peptidase [Thermoleophilia bacterium]